MMSRADALICVDLAQAAAGDALSAIIRKCELIDDTQQRQVVLELALGSIAQRHRALVRVCGVPGLDQIVASSDHKTEQTLRDLMAAAGIKTRRQA